MAWRLSVYLQTFKKRLLAYLHLNLDESDKALLAILRFYDSHKAILCSFITLFYCAAKHFRIIVLYFEKTINNKLIQVVSVILELIMLQVDMFHRPLIYEQ